MPVPTQATTALDAFAPGLGPLDPPTAPDAALLIRVVATLAFAAMLGGAMAWHPTQCATVADLEDAEAPRAYVVYGMVGALVGVLVQYFGPAMGVVVFGIGGLFRFRTALATTPRTGWLILTTVLGLAAGLGVPYVAAAAAAFAWGLMWLLESGPIYRLEVKGLEEAQVGRAAEAYRAALAGAGAHVLSERKQPAKQQVAFIVRTPRRLGHERLARRLALAVPAEMRGMLDWTVD